MYAGIHGPQRSGKTYFCVRTCMDFIKYTDRDIYTNLPLNPDFLVRYCIGRKFRNLEKYYEVFRRIHLFMDFGSFKVKKEFAKKNRDFWRFCRFSRNYKIRFFKEYYSNPANIDTRLPGQNFPSYDAWPDEYYAAGYIWPTKWVFDFWRLTKRERTVFMFDEFYEYYSALDSRTRSAEIKKELLSFTRQHGHDNHHVYLITHKPDDLDKVIRDGFMYQYFIRNAKYTNIFKSKWLRGLKSPIQYFKIEGFVAGERDVQDSYAIMPDQFVFKCYESNSTGTTLKDVNSGNCKSDRYDDNRGYDFIHNFIKYFKQQGWVTFVFLSCAFLGCYFAYNAFKNVLPTNFKDEPKKPLNIVKKKELVGAGVSDLEITGVFSNKIIWSDNFKLQKGDLYHGLTVKKINPKSETVLFMAPNRSLHSIPFSGCRIKEQSSKKTKQKNYKK